MTHLAFVTANIVGTPHGKTWSQVATLKDQTDSETPKPPLFVVISITRDDEQEAAFIGKELIDQLAATFFTPEVKVFESLKQVIDLSKQAVSDPNITQYSMLFLTRVETKLYVAQVGEGSISLFRAGASFPLTSQKNQNTIIAGVLQAEDYVIVGTNSFYEHAYPTENLFDGKANAREIVEVLVPVLLSLPENADIAGIILSCQKEDEEVASIPQTPVITSPLPSQPEPPMIPVSPDNHSESEHPLFSSTPHIVIPTTSSQSEVLLHTRNKKLGNLKQHAKPILYALRQMKAPSSSPAPQLVGSAATFYTKHKKLILIGLIILTTLVILVGGGTKLWANYQAKQGEQALATAKQQIALAQTLRGTDNKKAMELIEQASQAINTLKQKYPNLVIDQELLNTLAQQKRELFAVVAVENPETLFDLTLIKDGFSGSKLTVSGNNMLAVDATAPTLLLLNTPEKTGVIASGGTKLANFITAGLLTQGVVALLPDGVYSINTTTGDPTLVIKKDDLWKKIVDLATFANNVYLLDGEAGQVWKYTGAEGSFGSIKNVVNETQGLLSSPQSLTIDGTFWVVQNGTIVEIQNGKVIPFTIENIDMPLGPVLRIASSSDSENIYVLDKQNNRIVVSTKEGQYVRQYKSDALQQVVDIAIAEDESQLYLLTRDKVLYIPLTL